ARRLPVEPGGRAAALAEEGDRDDADVGVVARLGGVRFVHRAEAKGGHLVEALAKAVDPEALPGLEHVPALLEGAGAAGEHVQPVDGGARLDALVAAIVDLDRVALAASPLDVGPAVAALDRQRRAPGVHQANAQGGAGEGRALAGGAPPP